MIPRPVRSDGTSRTNFQLRYQYPAPSDSNRKVSLGFWSPSTLTNDSLREALPKGPAMADHLTALGDEVPERLESHLDIPAEYWPDNPVVAIPADDVLFYLERLKIQLTTKTCGHR